MMTLALLLSLASAAGSSESVAAADAPAPALLLDVTWEEQGLATGRIALVEVSAPRALTSLEGTFGEHRVITLPASTDGRGWIALVPVSIEAKPKPATLSLEGTLVDGSAITWSKPVPVVEAPYDERKLTVGKQFVKPSRKQRLRAAKEAKALSKVLDTTSAERLWRGSFAKPTAGDETSPFGTRRTYNAKKKSRHMGLDLDGKTGDAIVAANRGRVVMATERFYSGGTVVVDHGQGLFTMYFHMSRIDVKAGELVEKGQGLGAIGASGQVTGPHLHFSVRLGGMYLDPKYTLALDLSRDALDTPPAPPPVAAKTPSAAATTSAASTVSPASEARQAVP